MKADSMIIGTSMVPEIYPILHAQVSHYLLYEKTNLQMDMCVYKVRVETDKPASNIQAISFVARNLERHVKGIQAGREAKMGEQKKNDVRQC